MTITIIERSKRQLATMHVNYRHSVHVCCGSDSENLEAITDNQNALRSQAFNNRMRFGNFSLERTNNLINGLRIDRNGCKDNSFAITAKHLTIVLANRGRRKLSSDDKLTRG